MVALRKQLVFGVLIVVLISMQIGCGFARDNGTLLTDGLQVSASTSGDTQDHDGYVVLVDDSLSQEIGPNDTVAFPDLGKGTYQVELSGLAENCISDGQTLRSVLIKAGETTSISFSVSCVSTIGKSVVEQSCSGDGTFRVGGGDFRLAVNKWGASEATECIQRFADSTYGWRWDRGVTSSIQPNFPNVLHGARPFGGDDTGAEGFPIQKKDLDSLTVHLDVRTELRRKGKWHLGIETWITSKKPDGTRQAEFITHEIMLILTWGKNPPHGDPLDSGAVIDKYGNTIDYWHRAAPERYGGWHFHTFRIHSGDVPEKVEYTALYDYLQQRFGKSSPISPSSGLWINGVQLGNEYFDRTSGQTVVEQFSVTVNGQKSKSVK